MRCINSLVSNRREFPSSEEVDRLSGALYLDGNYIHAIIRGIRRGDIVPLVWDLQYSISELPIALVLLEGCL